MLVLVKLSGSPATCPPCTENRAARLITGGTRITRVMICPAEAGAHGPLFQPGIQEAGTGGYTKMLSRPYIGRGV